MEVSAPAELAAGRALLLSLAADVIVRGHHFAAGEEIPYGGETLRLAESTLEVWERDPSSGASTAEHRACSRPSRRADDRRGGEVASRSGRA